MEYKIEFAHLVEERYYARVEANTREEAIEKFEKDPFSYAFPDPFDYTGQDIEILGIENE